MKYFLLFCISILVSIQSLQSQTSYTWSGATSTAWNVAANWIPIGIPGGNAGDNVTIVTGLNNCVLNANTAIANITMTSGTLDLGGFTLSPTGNAIFTAGTITHGTLTINGAAANTALLTNTAFSATSVLSITTGAITINGGTYSGAVTLNQTGATNINCNGGATFNSTLSLTVSGSGYFFMHGGCTYNGATIFNFSGSNGNGFLPELNTGSTYNNNLTLNNTATAGNIRMAYAGATAFNGNIIVSNTGGGNFTFCESAVATATLANTKTIVVGGSGFTVGTLTMNRFTQVGATAQNLVFTGSASMIFNNSTTFNGALTVSAPNLYTSNSTYNGVTVLTKTDGTTSNNFAGGNTFNNTLTLNYTAANAVNVYWGFAANTPDIYNGDLYINNSSTDRILWGVGASTGNQLNGNLIVTQTGTAVGIATAWSAGTTWTMAAGKNISIGGAGFTAGYLGLSGLTTSSPVNLTTTGSSAVYLGTISGTAPSTFGSSVTVTAPNIYVRGTTISGVTVLTKTDGTTSNNSTGGNTFNNTLTLNYTASNAVNAYWGFAANTPDIYNGDLYVNNSSTDRILWGVGASIGNQLNGNLIITQTGSAVGIATAWSAGTTWTTAAGKNISIGAAGFTVGYLGIGGLTTSSPLNLVTTGSSSVILGTTSGVTPCTFGSIVNITAPDIYVRGNTFNAPAYFTKTGGVSNHNNGVQNIFNASCTVNQQSNGGYFMLGYNSNEQFNDSIIVTSTGTGGLALGWNAGTGTPTLAAGKSVFIGSAGFSTGYLRFGGFTQLGNVPINLTLTGTAAFYINSNTSGNSIFNAVFNATAPDIYVQGGTFNSRAYFTKTGGTSNNNSQIQNTFNASCNINQQSSAGYFMLGYNTNDMFNDSIIVSSTGTGGIYFGANNTLGTPTLASGKSIFVGTAGFSAGFLVFNHFTQLGNATVNLTFSGASAGLYFQYNSVFGGNVITNTPDIYFNGGTFSGTVSTTKTGVSQDNGSGGNIFNGVSTFNLAAGAGNLLFGNGTADTWNATVNFNNSSSSWIYPCYNSAGNMFNNNITVSNTGAAGIQFCVTAIATATLATGNTISVGAGGFTAGTLRIYGFTQLGATAQNLSLTGSATIVLSNSSTFNGALTVSSPNVYTSNSTYNGVTVLTKTDGTTSNNFAGGNVFNNTLTINYTAANAVGVYWGFGSATPDIYNGDVYINNSSTDRILWGVNASTGTQFNGNVIVTQTGTAIGIATAWAAGSTCTMAAGKTISIGVAGFTTGYLGLCGLTQNGSAPVTLTTTGNSSIYVGAYAGNAPSVFGGVVRLTAPDIYVRGGTFNQPAYFTKNGGGSNHNNGFQNIFNASCNINQQSSGGYFMLGYNSNDQFNDSIIVSSTGTGGINLGYSSGTGTPTLASGKSVFVGSSGFSNGFLYFGTFTQLGSAAVNLTFTGASTALYFANSSVFGGNVTTTSPALFFNGCTFKGTVTSTKNGTSNDASTGNNTFNNAFTITNTGVGYFLMGNGNPDTWNGTATFNNLSSAQHMYTAYNSTGNIFNGDVVYNNQPTATNLWIYPNNNGGGTNTQYNGNISVINVNGGGIYFGSGVAGTSVLAIGKTISVGASGFNFGSLNLKNFTQTGATAQSITTTGLSTLQFLTGTTFNGNLTTVSPTLLFNGSTFNGSVNSTKNGTSNDQSTGANTFNGTTTITVSNTGYLRLAGTTADAYNGNVTFVQSSTGAISPSYNTNCTYAGNITVTSPAATAITFGSGAAGISTMNGSGATAQTINITTGKTPVFTQFVMNNTGSVGATLNTPINVSTSLTLTSGLLNTTATNLLVMLNASTAPALTSASATYVNGPMQYQKSVAGATTLNFPIGTSPDCRPVALTVNHSTATQYNYTAQLFNANPWVAFNSGSPYIATNMPTTVDTISGVHYWTIARTDAAGISQPSASLNGNQQIQINFGTNDGVYQGANLTIVKNTAATPAVWIDIGGSCALGNFSSGQAGNVTSTSAPTAFTSFSSFTLGSKNSGWNPLPIELLNFNAVPNGKEVDVTWETTTETNNHYFTVERSDDGVNFTELVKVNTKADQGNSTTELSYKTIDTNPLNGISYYRLKQTDYNNNFKYFNVVSVDFSKKSYLTIFPNPTANTIYVHASSDYTNASVKIMDALGREVIEQNLTTVDNASINLASLMPGVYYVIIDNGTDINKTKITVQQ